MPIDLGRIFQLVLMDLVHMRKEERREAGDSGGSDERLGLNLTP